MSTQHKNTSADRTSQVNRWLIVALVAMIAFFATYRYAEARGAAAATTLPGGVVAAGPYTGQGASGTAGQVGGGGGCCGSGGAGPKVSKQAEAGGGVQKISVELSSGSYNPNEIKLKAGVPAQITFGQGSGCLSYVQSQDLGFGEDLSGGPKTVQIPALKAGTYTFTCGMGMVSGSIVVE